MPRKAKWNRDGTSSTPKPIDLRLRGLGRVQVSSGVLAKSAYEARVNAIKEAWSLGGVAADAVRALHAGRCTLDAFMQARADGVTGFEALVERSSSDPLTLVIRDYLKQSKATDTAKMKQRLSAFASAVGKHALMSDVTDTRVADFLAGLLDQRTIKSGRNVPAAGSTRNRYRAVIGGLCTWAVKTKRMTTHPIRDGLVEKYVEPHHRLPEMSADEYRDYVATARSLRPDLTICLLTLLHTAPDVGEIWELLAKDCDLERGRLRYDRPKTVRYGPLPRYVPMPALLREEMRAHLAEYGVRGSQPLFGMVQRSEVEWLHKQARAAIQRPELTLKDLRHVAAIAWVKAGVHIRLVQRWLGHRSLSQTMRYTDYEPGAEMAVEMAERAALTLNQTADVVPLRTARSANDS